VESVAKGDTVPGPEVAKRLLGQCANAKLTAKQLSEILCERARRLYLGLDSVCQGDTDAALVRLLALIAALAQQDSALAKDAVGEIKSGISEELLSLQSSARHRAESEPMLRRIGLLNKIPDMVDLLGGETAAPAMATDLLGGAAAKEVDLLGGFDATPSPAACPGDLL